MGVRINCTKNKQGAWCKDKRTPRSLFSIGARICKAFYGEECPYQDKYVPPDYVVVGQCRKVN